MIQGLHSSLAKLTAQFTVSLQWVPAHVGLTGNEKADRLAKIGSQGPQTQNPVTYREAKTLLHSRYNGDWKKYNDGYQAHLDPICRLERAQQTTIFRLRTVHCGLSAHLKRIGISDTSLCECRQADQTPDHVLQSCPKYAERRQLTWPQGADLTTKLWGSSEDLYQTVLWHQPDWRSDLHGCWSLEKKKKNAASWVWSPLKRIFPEEGIFPLELTWALTPFPQTLSDEGVNQVQVCVHMHSIVWTQKILTFMS